MPWNWELPDWPYFTHNANQITDLERQFLLSIGNSMAFLKTINEQDRDQFIVEILSLEGLESSKIEGEILDRASLQSSIKQHFGLHSASNPTTKKEIGMAKLLCSVYESFDEPLTHDMLCQWHLMLFQNSSNRMEYGKYRTHIEPMQIVSAKYENPKVFFEAPPSIKIPHEMNLFINWFNSSRSYDSILLRASIAHVYFESIHPFEDGNGRIGRALVEKILSQGIRNPTLIAVSKVLERRKKEYYTELEKCNRTLQITSWINFFSTAILQAQEESMHLLFFLIEKAKMFLILKDQLNPRQEKALLRMFAEGLNGFQGGLSSENYIRITKTSKATATRDLTDLVQKGALIKTGELRHTRYWLNTKNSH